MTTIFDEDPRKVEGQLEVVDEMYTLGSASVRQKFGVWGEGSCVRKELL